MSFKSNLVAALMVLGLSSHATATDSGHGALSSCPASCVQTVPVTVTASCTEQSSKSQTSTIAYLETHTSAGPHVNASSTDSSTIPYTTVTNSEPTSTIHTYPTYNTSGADPVVTSTSSGKITYSYATPPDPALTSETSDPVSSVITTTFSTTENAAYPTLKPNRCHHNNCLRQFIRNPQMSEFCATYTTTINTATTDLPDYVFQCHADPTRISSACSCIAASTTSSVPASISTQTTKTAGGIYYTVPNYPMSPPTTAAGCSVASVVFETYTMTTIISVTVSASAEISTSLNVPGTGIETVTSSATVVSSTPIPYFNFSSDTLGTSTR